MPLLPAVCGQRTPTLRHPARPLLAERRELLSAAADGSLAVTPLDADDAGSSQSLFACGGAVSFSAARWNGAHSAVTGSLQGEAVGIAACPVRPAAHTGAGHG